jgi:hypothetical protein
MYVGIAVGVVLHRRWGGVVRNVLRLVGQKASEERIKGWNEVRDWLDRRS